MNEGRCSHCKHPIGSHRVKVLTSERGRITVYRATWRCKVEECGCKFKTFSASFKHKKPREE